MNITQKQNNKLFYKKYAYRFTAVLPGVAHACKMLLKTGVVYHRVIPVKPHILERFNDLHDIFKNKDTLVRVESARLSIYTSELSLINELENMQWWCEIEVTKPKNQQHTDFLLSNKDVIIGDTDGFKATIGAVPYSDVKHLKNWADTQPFIIARSIQHRGEGYLVFSDEKYLSMLLLNGNIKVRKVEKIISQASIS